MKKIIYIVVFTLSFELLSQDPQLFDTNWTLYELNINDTSILPSHPLHISEATFNDEEDSMSVSNIECEKVFLGDFTNFTDSIFELFDFVDPFGFGCTSDIAFDYLENHSLFYISDPTDSPNNPFNYEITNENGILTLIITNGNNDTATYRNVSLGLEESSIDILKIVYNVQNERITLKGFSVQQTIEVAIYTVTGKKQQENVLNPNTHLNVKSLSKGVYLLTLKNKVGQQITRKFVKY